jgi:hypothetical protein
MSAIHPTITITFDDGASLTADEVAQLTAKIMALLAGRTVTPAYSSNNLALVVT